MAAVKKSKTITVEMTVDKDTKNTRKYLADDDNAAISTLYINKSASTPDTIVVTVAAG